MPKNAFFGQQVVGNPANLAAAAGRVESGVRGLVAQTHRMKLFKDNSAGGGAGSPGVGGVGRPGAGLPNASQQSVNKAYAAVTTLHDSVKQILAGSTVKPEPQAGNSGPEAGNSGPGLGG